MNAYLEIKSTNPDIEGFWNASDIEAEMIDLEIPIKTDTDWIEYIITRDFIDEEYGFPKPVFDCIKLFKNAKFKIEFQLGSDRIAVNYDVSK